MSSGNSQCERRGDGVSLCVALLVAVAMLGGCARLPYTTKTLHQDRRVVINAQEELDRPGYTHPATLSPSEVAAILAGLSTREQQRLPLRWFAEEVPPKAIFRADEIEVLAPYLAEALTKVGPDERVHFEVIAPGLNPSMSKDSLGGLGRCPGPLSISDARIFSHTSPDSNYRPLRLQLSHSASAGQKLHRLFRARPILGHGREGHSSGRLSTILQIS